MSLRHDGKRLGLSLAVNNKSIAKIVLFAILFPFSMKNFPVPMQTIGYYMQSITLTSARICSDDFVTL